MVDRDAQQDAATDPNQAGLGDSPEEYPDPEEETDSSEEPGQGEARCIVCGEIDDKDNLVNVGDGLDVWSHDGPCSEQELGEE